LRNHAASRVIATPRIETPLQPGSLATGTFVVFCFAKAKDAEAFALRFGGERLPGGAR
jgi:hypothetical protein